MPLAFASFGYAIVTAYAGGEVRSPRSSGRRAMLWSLLISGILVAVLMGLASRTFGNDFLGSATFLSNNGDEAYPFGSPSFFFFYVSMLTGSSFLIALISFSFIVAFIVALPATFLIATRNLFAWSFDRILPSRVSDVNERTRSPLVANAIVLAVTLIYLGLIVYGSSKFLEIFFTAGMAELLTFMVVALTAIWFPFRRRSAVRGFADPALVRWRFRCSRSSGWRRCWSTCCSSTRSRPTTPSARTTTTGWVATAIIAGLGIAIYPVSYLINKARGIDLRLAFRELPPE